eukprot:Phypoly_transcript_07274.p1 GENE.Phypoly_transcript_07274~~Phypoly_transcript_07274.p1  ORF type:complete len:266 (+),score=21.61 Phypoly_transcript_07274:117-914(+)
MVAKAICVCLLVTIFVVVGANPDPSTINKKVLFGYQGWFGTPARGNVGWFHWSQNGQPPSGSNSNFDVWPDLSEFAANELYPTNLHYSNGQTAGLYLASDPRTINRHFQWMQNYGLDGILLQRFVNEIASPDDPHGQMRNDVTRAVINAASATGRVWAIEYDTSGADPNSILSVLQNDWKYLFFNIFYFLYAVFMYTCSCVRFGFSFSFSSFDRVNQCAEIRSEFSIRAPNGKIALLLLFFVFFSVLFYHCVYYLFSLFFFLFFL